MKVDGLSIGLLLSMEDFGYQSLIQEMLPDLPLETADEGYSDKLKSAVEDYRTAYRAFDDAVETSGTTSPAVIAARHDKARDNAWRTLRAYVKVCTRHPDPDVAATSTRALQLIRNIGDLSIRNRTDETGRINTLIQSLREIGAAPLAQAGITPFIDDLERKDRAYREAYQHWIDVKGDRTIGLVQLKRRAADAAYRNLITTVNALIHLNGDAPYAAFVRSVNALIKRNKTALITRQTLRAKRHHSLIAPPPATENQQHSES